MTPPAAALEHIVRRSAGVLGGSPTPTDLDLVTTHSFDLTDVSAAMDLQDTGHCGKVLLLADEDRSTL